jgi:hypothetical protein
MSARPRKKLIDFLRAHAAFIDRDAAIAIQPTKNGLVVTFTWAFDGKRDVRLSFSGVTPDERAEAMIAWLNGDLHRGLT